ncbi:MAG: hypothetical protein K940chlam9_00239 [Chlamydiae bacterium]|nr:hypothetical protein [Chlamydiota bacterium]
MIDGKVMTLAHTKYNLYGANAELVGIAYNNDDASSVYHR